MIKSMDSDCVSHQKQNGKLHLKWFKMKIARPLLSSPQICQTPGREGKQWRNEGDLEFSPAKKSN